MMAALGSRAQILRSSLLKPDQAFSPYLYGFYYRCSNAPIHHINSEHNFNILVPPVPSDLMIKVLKQIGRCRELRRGICSEALDTCITTTMLFVDGLRN